MDAHPSLTFEKIRPPLFDSQHRKKPRIPASQPGAAACSTAPLDNSAVVAPRARPLLRKAFRSLMGGSPGGDLQWVRQRRAWNRLYLDLWCSWILNVQTAWTPLGWDRGILHVGKQHWLMFSNLPGTWVKLLHYVKWMIRKGNSRMSSCRLLMDFTGTSSEPSVFQLHTLPYQAVKLDMTWHNSDFRSKSENLTGRMSHSMHSFLLPQVACSAPAPLSTPSPRPPRPGRIWLRQLTQTAAWRRLSSSWPQVPGSVKKRKGPC